MDNGILYEDFEGIRITSERFYAYDTEYSISEIEGINFTRQAPARVLSITCFVFGLFLVLLGALGMFNTNNILFHFLEKSIPLSEILLITGLALVSFSAFRMFLVKDIYAIEITTQDGSRETVFTKNRNRAARLVASLKRAYYRQKAVEKGNTDLVIN